MNKGNVSLCDSCIYEESNCPMNPPGCTSSCIGFKKKSTLQGWSDVITEFAKQTDEDRERWQVVIGEPSQTIQVEENTYGFWRVNGGVCVIEIDKRGPNPATQRFYSEEFIGKLVETHDEVFKR